MRSRLGQHGTTTGNLAKFIERAVQKEFLTQTAADVKQRNSELTGDQLQALIDEAVAAARKEGNPRFAAEFIRHRPGGCSMP